MWLEVIPIFVRKHATVRRGLLCICCLLSVGFWIVSVIPGRMSTLAFVMGPFNHYWYCFLDRLLPGARTATVAKKILMDQVFASPFFAFTFFMGKHGM